MNNLFADYAKTSTGTSWTGADGMSSIVMPTGGTLWTFDDTFLGTVNSKGIRIRSKSPIIRNSMVMEDGGGNLTQTFYGLGKTGKPISFINPESKTPLKYGFWPYSETTSGDTLYVLGSEYKFGKTSFSFQKVGDSSISIFSLPGLHQFGSYSISPSNNITWISFLNDGSGTTYEYGTLEDNTYVAKVPSSNVLSAQQYYDGTGWAPTASQAVPIATGIKGDSVTKVDNFYLLLSLQPSKSSGQIVAYTSCSPTGPFTDRQNIYSTPEQHEYPAKYKILTYGAIAQATSVTDPNSVIVSYSVNGPGSGIAIQTTSVYRPRFLSVTFTS